MMSIISLVSFFCVFAPFYASNSSHESLKKKFEENVLHAKDNIGAFQNYGFSNKINVKLSNPSNTTISNERNEIKRAITPIHRNSPKKKDILIFQEKPQKSKQHNVPASKSLNSTHKQNELKANKFRNSNADNRTGNPITPDHIDDIGESSGDVEFLQLPSAALIPMPPAPLPIVIQPAPIVQPFGSPNYADIIVNSNPLKADALTATSVKLKSLEDSVQALVNKIDSGALDHSGIDATNTLNNIMNKLQSKIDLLDKNVGASGSHWAGDSQTNRYSDYASSLLVTEMNRLETVISHLSRKVDDIQLEIENRPIESDKAALVGKMTASLVTLQNMMENLASKIESNVKIANNLKAENDLEGTTILASHIKNLEDSMSVLDDKVKSLSNAERALPKVEPQVATSTEKLNDSHLEESFRSLAENVKSLETKISYLMTQNNGKSESVISVPTQSIGSEQSTLLTQQTKLGEQIAELNAGISLLSDAVKKLHETPPSITTTLAPIVVNSSPLPLPRPVMLAPIIVHNQPNPVHNHLLNVAKEVLKNAADSFNKVASASTSPLSAAGIPATYLHNMGGTMESNYLNGGGVANPNLLVESNPFENPFVSSNLLYGAQQLNPQIGVAQSVLKTEPNQFNKLNGDSLLTNKVPLAPNGGGLQNSNLLMPGNSLFLPSPSKDSLSLVDLAVGINILKKLSAAAPLCLNVVLPSLITTPQEKLKYLIKQWSACRNDAKKRTAVLKKNVDCKGLGPSCTWAGLKREHIPSFVSHKFKMAKKNRFEMQSKFVKTNGCKSSKECNTKHLSSKLHVKVIKRNVDDHLKEPDNETGKIGKSILNVFNHADSDPKDDNESKLTSLNQNLSIEPQKNESSYLESQFIGNNNKNYDYPIFGNSLTKTHQNSTESLIERISRIKEELKKQFSSESSGEGEHSQSGKEKSFVIRPISLFKQANRTLDISSLNSLGIESTSTTIPLTSMKQLIKSIKSGDTSVPVDENSNTDSSIRAIQMHKNDTLFSSKGILESQEHLHEQKSELADLQPEPELHNQSVEPLHRKIGTSTNIDDIGKLQPDAKLAVENAIANFRENKYKNQIEELQRYLNVVPKQDLIPKQDFNVIPKLDLSKNIVAPEFHSQSMGERVPGLSHLESVNHVSYGRHNGELEDSKQYRHHHKWEVDPSLLYEKYGEFKKNHYRHHHEHPDYNYDEGAGNDDGGDEEDNETEINQSNLDDVEANHQIEAENHRHKSYHDRVNLNRNKNRYHFFEAERGKMNRHTRGSRQPYGYLKHHSTKKTLFQEGYHENMHPMTDFRQHGNKWLFGPGPHHIAFPSKMDDDTHGKGHSLRPLYGMTTHEREDDEDYDSPEEKYANDEDEQGDEGGRRDNLLREQKHSRRRVGKQWSGLSSKQGHFTNEFRHIRKTPLEFFNPTTEDPDKLSDSVEGEGHHYEYHQDNHDEYTHGNVHDHHDRLEDQLDTDHSHHEAFIHHDDEDLEIRHTDSGIVGDDNTEAEQNLFRGRYKNKRVNYPFEQSYSKSTIGNSMNNAGLNWNANRRRLTKYDCKDYRNCQTHDDENKIVLDSLFASTPYFSIDDDQGYGHFKRRQKTEHEKLDKETRNLVEMYSSVYTSPMKEDYLLGRSIGDKMSGKSGFIEKRSKTKTNNPAIAVNLWPDNLKHISQSIPADHPYVKNENKRNSRILFDKKKLLRTSSAEMYGYFYSNREKNQTNLSVPTPYKLNKTFRKVNFLKNTSKISNQRSHHHSNSKHLKEKFSEKVNHTSFENKTKKGNFSHKSTKSAHKFNPAKTTSKHVANSKKKNDNILVKQGNGNVGAIKKSLCCQKYEDNNRSEDNKARNNDFSDYRDENHYDNDKSSEWNPSRDQAEEMLPTGYINAEHHGVYKKLDHETGELYNLFNVVSEKNFGSDKMEEKFLEKAIGLTNTQWGLNKRTNFSSHNKDRWGLKKRSGEHVKPQKEAKRNHVIAIKQKPAFQNVKDLKLEDDILPSESDILPREYLNYEKNYINRQIGDENKAMKLLFERVSRSDNGNSEPEKAFLKKMVLISGADWGTGHGDDIYRLNSKPLESGRRQKRVNSNLISGNKSSFQRRDKTLPISKQFLKTVSRVNLSQSNHIKKSKIFNNTHVKIKHAAPAQLQRNFSKSSIKNIKKHLHPQNHLGFKKNDITDEANWLMKKYQPTNQNENVYLSIVNDFNHMPSIIDKIEGKMSPSESLNEMNEDQRGLDEYNNYLPKKELKNKQKSFNKDSPHSPQDFFTEIWNDNHVVLSELGNDKSLLSSQKTFETFLPQTLHRQFDDNSDYKQETNRLQTGNKQDLVYFKDGNTKMQFGEKLQLPQSRNDASFDKLDFQQNHEQLPFHVSLSSDNPQQHYRSLAGDSNYLDFNTVSPKNDVKEGRIVYDKSDKSSLTYSARLRSSLLTPEKFLTLNNQKVIESQFFKRTGINTTRLKSKDERVDKRVHIGEVKWLIKMKNKKNNVKKAKEYAHKKFKNEQQEKTGLYRPVSIVSILNRDNDKSQTHLTRTNDWHSGHEKGTHYLGGDGHGGVLKKLGDDRSYDRGNTCCSEEEDEEFGNENDFEEESKNGHDYEHDYDDHESHAFKHQTYREHHHDEDLLEGNDRSHHHHERGHHHHDDDGDHHHDDDGDREDEDMMMQDHRWGLKEKSMMQKGENEDNIAEAIDKKFSDHESLAGPNFAGPIVCNDERCVMRDNFPAHFHISKGPHLIEDDFSNQNAYRGTSYARNSKLRNEDGYQNFNLAVTKDSYKNFVSVNSYVSDKVKDFFLVSRKDDRRNYDNIDHIRNPSSDHKNSYNSFKKLINPHKKNEKLERKKRTIETVLQNSSNLTQLNFTKEQTDSVNATIIFNSQAVEERPIVSATPKKHDKRKKTDLKKKHKKTIKNVQKQYWLHQHKKQKNYRRMSKKYRKKSPHGKWESSKENNIDLDFENNDNGNHHEYEKKPRRKGRKSKFFHYKHGKQNDGDNYLNKVDESSDHFFDELAEPEFDIGGSSENVRKIGDNSFDISPQSYYSAEDTSDNYSENPSEESSLDENPGIRNQESFRKEYRDMPSEFVTGVNNSLSRSNLSGKEKVDNYKPHIKKISEYTPSLFDGLNGINNEVLQKRPQVSSPQIINSGNEQQLIYFPNDVNAVAVNAPWDISAAIETGTNQYIQIKPTTADSSKTQGYARDKLNRDYESRFPNFRHYDEPMYNRMDFKNNEDMPKKYPNGIQINDDRYQHGFANVPEFDSKSLNSDYLSRLIPEKVRKIEQQRFAEKVTKETTELSHLFDDIKLHDDKQPEEKFVGEVTHLVGTKWGLEGNMGYKVHYPHIRRNKDREFRKLIVNLNEPGVPMGVHYSPSHSFQSVNDDLTKSNDHDYSENSHRRSVQLFLEKTPSKLLNGLADFPPIRLQENLRYKTVNKLMPKHGREKKSDVKSFYVIRPSTLGARKGFFGDKYLMEPETEENVYNQQQHQLGMLKEPCRFDKDTNNKNRKMIIDFQNENALRGNAFKKNLVNDATLQTDEDNRPILTGSVSSNSPVFRESVGRFKNSFSSESLKDDETDCDKPFRQESEYTSNVDEALHKTHGKYLSRESLNNHKTSSKYHDRNLYLPLDDHPAHYLFRHIARGGSLKDFDPQNSINDYLRNHDPKHIRHRFHFGLRKHHHRHKDHPNPFVKEDPEDSRSLRASGVLAFEASSEKLKQGDLVKKFYLGENQNRTISVTRNAGNILALLVKSELNKKQPSKSATSVNKLLHKNKRKYKNNLKVTGKKIEMQRSSSPNKLLSESIGKSGPRFLNKLNTKALGYLERKSNSVKKKIINAKPRLDESDNEPLYFQTIGTQNEPQDSPNIRESMVSSTSFSSNASPKLPENYASFQLLTSEGLSDSPPEKSPSSPSKACKYSDEFQMLTSEGKTPIKEDPIPSSLTTPKPLKDLRLYQMLTSEGVAEKEDCFKHKVTTSSDTAMFELFTSEGDPRNKQNNNIEKEQTLVDEPAAMETRNYSFSSYKSLKLKNFDGVKPALNSSFSFESSKTNLHSSNDDIDYAFENQLQNDSLKEPLLYQKTGTEFSSKTPTSSPPVTIVRSTSKYKFLGHLSELSERPQIPQSIGKETRLSSDSFGSNEDSRGSSQDKQRKNQSTFKNVKNQPNQQEIDNKLSSMTPAIDNEKTNENKTEKYYAIALKALKNIKLPKIR